MITLYNYHILIFVFVMYVFVLWLTKVELDFYQVAQVPGNMFSRYVL